MSAPLTVFARVRAKAGQESQLLQELLALIAPTRAEAGCIDYDLHQSQSDPAVFVFYENWASQAALDAHARTPHLQAYLKRIPDIAEGAPEITKWTRVR
jgi:quinol monooxygenase YgiN